MTLQFKFRAQSLDGISPDHLQVSDHLVGEGDDQTRKGAANEIAKISQGGRILGERDGVEVMRYRNQIMIKMYALQRDNRGRRSPLLCWGALNEVDIEEFGRAALDGLGTFATSIGCALDTAPFALIEKALADEKKKTASRRLIVVLAVVGATLAVGYGISLQSSSTADGGKIVSSESAARSMGQE